MVTYIEKEFKSILNVMKFIDGWFWTKYSVNPYNGCQFGCVYCDSRSEKYHLPTDFENMIIVKKNPSSMLDKRLTNARTLLPDVVGIAGTTDPYQPAEKKYENTRRCLEVLAKHRYPVLIGTKSSLVLRDLEILDTIGRIAWCTVAMTITTANPEKARFLETQAPSPEIRFDAIRTIKERARQVKAGVLLMPTVPLITDSENDIEQMIRASKDAKADFVLFGAGMTMRDLQAKWFLKKLKEKDPTAIQGYEKLYQFRYDPESYSGAYGPPGKYSKSLNEIFFRHMEKHNLPYRIKRYIPDDYRKDNYAIAEELLNEAYRRQATGKAWSGMFWAGQNIQNLKEPIGNIFRRNELRTIRSVDNEVESTIGKYFGMRA